MSDNTAMAAAVATLKRSHDDMARAHEDTDDAPAAKKPRTDTEVTLPPPLPYVFIVLSEQVDASMVYTLQDEGEASAAIVAAIEAFAAVDRKQRRASAAEALGLYVEGRTLEMGQDDAWAAKHPALAGITQTGKWSVDSVIHGDAISGAKRIVLVYE